MCVWALISCDVSGNLVNSSVWGDREPASQSPVSPLPPQRPQAFHPEINDPDPTSQVENVERVVLIILVCSVPRNSDFERKNGDRLKKGTD